MSDLSTIKSRQQQMWATGDFAMVGLNAMLVSELLCEAVDLRAGQTVLDVATGSGNAALPAYVITPPQVWAETYIFMEL